MAKRSGFPKSKTISPKEKRRPPKAGKIDGRNALMCPFCRDAHELIPGQPSKCGTRIEVMAVQPVFSASMITCLKCGKPGGTMVRYRNQYIHDYDCAPETGILEEQPKFSRIAAFIFHYPEGWFRNLLIKIFGVPLKVTEMNPETREVMGVAGYYFSGQEVKHV